MSLLSELEGEGRVLIGWEKMLAFTQLSDHFVRRHIKLYDFPQPRYFGLRQSAGERVSLHCVWREEEVRDWMTKNKGPKK